MQSKRSDARLLTDVKSERKGMLVMKRQARRDAV
jgi:hypothetical protein